MIMLLILILIATTTCQRKGLHVHLCGCRAFWPLCLINVQKVPFVWGWWTPWKPESARRHRSARFVRVASLQARRLSYVTGVPRHRCDIAVQAHRQQALQSFSSDRISPSDYHDLSQVCLAWIRSGKKVFGRAHIHICRYIHLLNVRRTWACMHTYVRTYAHSMRNGCAPAGHRAWHHRHALPPLGRVPLQLWHGASALSC